MISIIIPIYNAEKYLKQCLDSVKNQTFSDFEALLIDDGCTDNSKKIIDEYVKEDSRFKYLGGTHIGFPFSKNLGLDNARGEYICFLDSDDYLDSKYLELLLKGLQNTQSDICCCKYICYSGDDPIIRQTPFKVTNVLREDKMQKLFSTNFSTFMWNKLFKKEVFDNLRFEDMIALSDTALCYKLFEKAKTVSSISCSLIYHRMHDENMTYKMKHFEPTYWEHRLNVYLTMCSYLAEKYPQYKETYTQVFRREFYSIKSHLTEDRFMLYNNKDEVKKLL